MLLRQLEPRKQGDNSQQRVRDTRGERTAESIWVQVTLLFQSVFIATMEMSRVGHIFAPSLQYASITTVNATAHRATATNSDSPARRRLMRDFKKLQVVP